jgi:hypothetical protein
VSDPSTSSGPPAGWYPDPAGGSGHRWWDGSAWTDHLSGPTPGTRDPQGPGRPEGTTTEPDLGGPTGPPAVASTPSPAPPGWYHDPAGEGGFRWWDGSTWTDTVTGPLDDLADGAGRPPAGSRSSSPGPGPIGEVDRLLSETFRLSGQRAGHLLPYVVYFVLSLGLIGAFAGWYGLRDTVVTIDEQSTAVDVDYGGSPVALIVYLVLFPLSMVGGVLAKAATARQTWAAQSGAPEPWSESLAGVLRRWRPLLFGAVGRTALYWVLGGSFVIGSVLVPPLILLFPVVAALFLFLWLRLAFISQAAVLAPAGSGPFSTSYRVSGQSAGRLLGRLIVLALVGAALLVVVSLTGSVFSALAGVENAVEPDPSGLVYDLNAYLGANVAFFALGSAFGALGLGANYVFAAVGTTLLYRNLDGPVDPAILRSPAGVDPSEVPEPSEAADHRASP